MSRPESSPVTVERLHFGSFEFDPSTGDLRHRDRPDGSDTRLPPQPARLLGLLADRQGGLVAREEIRQCLWPETHVDFDASLHFCIRQIREALGDSAADPQYIQTVPRRGYRLIPDVVRVDPAGGRRSEAAWPRRRLIAALALAALALSVGGLALRGGWLRASPVRVAIMPFPRPAGAEGSGDSSGVAEWILEDLARVAGNAAGIVGPTTTSAYGGSAADLQRLAADYNVQYILNGRLLEADGGSQMLAELIRVSDGVHVWVRRYDTAIEAPRLAREISRNVARALELGSAGGDGS